MSCPHILDHREASVYTEGLCPLCLCAENKALIEQTKSDAKVIAELNSAIAARNLEIAGDLKVIAALMQALEAIAQRSLDDPNTPAHELGHIAQQTLENY